MNNVAAAGAAVSLAPRVIELTEVIHVSDADETRPAIMIPIDERITVSDADVVTPVGGAILAPGEFVRATDARARRPLSGRASRRSNSLGC